MRAIKEAYQALHAAQQNKAQDASDIVIGYYVNVIYGLFENLFARIATAFGNQIHDQAQWHTQLLHRMTLDVQDIRPSVISREMYTALNELRRFRHVFRNAYVLHFDPSRLQLVLDEAEQLEKIYEAEFNAFLSFLDKLIAES
ncbi:MAG TPA: hypothetical protein VEC93_04000 [Anaerolineae bacterium]|nr:hypothetical protein [Anaerolineae bacterium]